MSIFPKNLLQKLPTLVFITGKGGTGKTFISSALAYELQKKKSVALISSSHIDQIGPLFGTQCNYGQTKKIHNLNLFNLSSKDNINLFIEKKFAGNFIIRQTVNSKFFSSFFKTVPGIKELMYLGQLIYLANSEEYDHIIVDSFATGHFLAMLRSPATLGNLHFTGKLFQDLRNFNDHICDHEKTGIIVVSNPEELVVKESKELISKIEDELNLNLLKQIINRFETTNLRSKELKVEDFGFIDEPIDFDKILKQKLSHPS